MVLRLVLVVLVLACGARAGEFARRHAEAAAELVSDLERFATWCKRKGGVDLERDRACELILRFDPDHGLARKLLGFRRDRSGRWARREVYVAPANRDSGREAEAVARLADIRARFVEAADSIRETVGGRATPAERQRLFADVLHVDPACRWAHESNGEIEWRGRWYLRETPVANQRRKEIAAAARTALRKAGRPVRCEVERSVREIGVEWTGAFLARSWRVAGTVPRTELELAARLTEAAPAVFEAALEGGPAGTGDRLLFLFASRRDRDAVIAALPGLDGRRRRELAGRSERSLWLLPGEVQAVCGDDRALRVTGFVKAWYRSMLEERFGLARGQGWIAEGIATHLCYELTGMRRLVPGVRAGTATERELIANANRAGASWYALARRLIESGEAPGLASVVSRPPDEMDAGELLVSYALATYLLESHPRKAVSILRALANEESPDAVLLERIGLDLEALAIRLPRWLDERV